MQALFYMDTQETAETAETAALERFCLSFQPSPKALPFFSELVNGVLQDRNRIDRVIERFSNNWKMSRMSCVDRNVLRIAVYELLRRPDIPAKVSINEAIDIGKKFGAEETGAFINGILDSIRLALEQERIDTEEDEPTGPDPP